MTDWIVIFRQACMPLPVLRCKVITNLANKKQKKNQ